jgi:hypothetical protein
MTAPEPVCRCFFSTDPERRVVELIARMEGEGGLVGDFRDVVRPGESFYGLSYSRLVRARSGSFVIGEDGRAVFDERSP